MTEKIVVKKWGEKMNSPYPHRRSLFFVVEPAEESALKTLKQATIELKFLMAQWDYFDPKSEWWVNHRECPQCKARQVYENSKFVAGEWVWNRKYCMRHYLVSHLTELLSQENIESNRPIEFSISKQEIALKFATNNYDYDVTIFRSHAVLSCEYKNKKYAFTYKNHTNALPYASTYFVLLKAINHVIQRFYCFFSSIAYDTDVCYNIYVNDILYAEAQD
jgi:hypothetical protein